MSFSSAQFWNLPNYSRAGKETLIPTPAIITIIKLRNGEEGQFCKSFLHQHLSGFHTAQLIRILIPDPVSKHIVMIFFGF